MVPILKNNVPGSEWAKQFLKRHRNLVARLCSNIKKDRATVDEKMLSEYHDYLKVILKGLTAENIWNYNETKLNDDPGVKL